MRLIDKDALIAYIKANGYVYANTLEGFPEADAVPVVRGEWLVTDAYPRRVYCSACYKTNVPNEEWLFEKNEYPHFCMWCGAKMESEGNQ